MKHHCITCLHESNSKLTCKLCDHPCCENCATKMASEYVCPFCYESIEGVVLHKLKIELKNTSSNRGD